MLFRSSDLINRGLEITDYNRMMLMWDEMVRDCVEALVCAVKDSPDEILLVNYDDLCNSPELVLKDINNFINLNLSYDLNNIDRFSIPQDDERSWGMSGMHSVRLSLSKVSGDPAEILGSELYSIFLDIDTEMRKMLGK